MLEKEIEILGMANRKSTVILHNLGIQEWGRLVGSIKQAQEEFDRLHPILRSISLPAGEIMGMKYYICPSLPKGTIKLVSANDCVTLENVGTS